MNDLNAGEQDQQGSPRDDARLIYELAQQSAEHHDTILWEVTYIIWGSTTLLLGFVLEAIKQEPLLSLMTASFSIFITIMVLRLALAYRRVRNQKYDICKEIETELQMKWKQHREQELHYPKGIQTRWYIATTFFFVFVWLCVALRSIYYLCHRS